LARKRHVAAVRRDGEADGEERPQDVVGRPKNGRRTSEDSTAGGREELQRTSAEQGVAVETRQRTSVKGDKEKPTNAATGAEDAVEGSLKGASGRT